MREPFITKDKMREHIENISLLAGYLNSFLSHNDEVFYEEVDSRCLDRPVGDGEGMRLDEIMADKVVAADVFIFELIPYLKAQPQAYISYFKQELLPEPMGLIADVLQGDKIEHRIFRYRNSDLVHDIYLILKAASRIFEDIDALIAGGDDVLDGYLDFRMSYLGVDENESEEGVSRATLHDAFVWRGTPAELACLMDTLHEKGYIDAPKRTNGERNNEGFSKLIGLHFRLADGSEKSVLNNLKDSRITPDNQFKTAMDKLPRKR